MHLRKLILVMLVPVLLETDWHIYYLQRVIVGFSLQSHQHVRFLLLISLTLLDMSWLWIQCTCSRIPKISPNVLKFQCYSTCSQSIPRKYKIMKCLKFASEICQQIRWYSSSYYCLHSYFLTWASIFLSLALIGRGPCVAGVPQKHIATCIANCCIVAQLFRVMQQIHLQGSSCCSVVFVPANQQVPMELGSAWLLHSRVGWRERNRLDFQCNLPTFPGHWFSSILCLPCLVSFTISLPTFGMIN